MKESEILKKDREDMSKLCKRMKPEERLMAYLNHSQLIQQIYQAGVRYRSGLLSSSKKKSSRKQ